MFLFDKFIIDLDKLMRKKRICSN